MEEKKAGPPLVRKLEKGRLASSINGSLEYSKQDPESLHCSPFSPEFLVSATVSKWPQAGRSKSIDLRFDIAGAGNRVFGSSDGL